VENYLSPKVILGYFFYVIVIYILNNFFNTLFLQNPIFTFIYVIFKFMQGSKNIQQISHIIAMAFL